MFPLHRLLLYSLACVFLTTCISTPLLARTQDEVNATSERTTQAEAEARDEVAESVQGDVDQQTAGHAEDARRKILDEAVSAVAQTEKALKALGDGDITAALDALERATGKLELILARDPDLALAPSAVSITMRDLFASRQTIQRAIAEAGDLLDDGQIQKARLLIRDLASEMVVSVSHIPLATYPDAIKAVAPLIDKGHYDEAKAALTAALNTIIVVDHVLPLPVIRAEAMLDQAEILAENAERTDEQNSELDELLSGAREQLEMAQLLGYGTKKDFKPLFKELKSIIAKTSDGKSGTGFFGTLRDGLTAIRESIFG